jgi:hypothetical protein
MTRATHAQTATQDTSRTEALTTQNHAAPSACCGGPAPTGTDACCVRDAEVKSTSGAGCGCGSTPAAPASKKTGCCG